MWTNGNGERKQTRVRLTLPCLLASEKTVGANRDFFREMPEYVLAFTRASSVNRREFRRKRRQFDLCGIVTREVSVTEKVTRSYTATLNVTVLSLNPSRPHMMY
jgi:hypothetical protein